VNRDVSFAPRRTAVAPVLGGILGLMFPFVLIVAALSVGFRSGGDMGDFAASLAGAVLFLVAAPTAWVLAFPFIDVTRFTVFVFGIVTSVPVWYLIGRAIAARSSNWIDWLRAYGIVCIAWTSFNLLLFGVIAALVG
jgi:mannitol-specific phosphotransferase system IIBC component